MRWTFPALLFILLSFGNHRTLAQVRDIPIEVVVGNRAVAHQMYLNKYLDSTSRFGYFGYLRYETPYENRRESTFFGQSLVFYDVAEGISLGGGGYVSNVGFLPQLIAGYSRNTGNISLMAFGTFEPVKSPNSEIFVLVTYSPPLNKSGSLRLFSQLMGSYNFNYKDNLKYNFANQYLRLGLGYKDWQFGLATDLVQERPIGLLPTNTGIFLRRLL
ncbi:hypothetical protein FUA48_11815 [Flavobacterium alkalisoli]|uniref:Uncharacterized protein n=1 Tax=Flavobacterium alkalisoli TaxID=2602769 RepID=A0A5B9FWT0_9FLAO|nr:hypothetical protein [Flavobacterium alkalisoli]QEE50238.1 hypothetical protein FUA48_11815 [Flavobacterium alkalisoli]